MNQSNLIAANWRGYQNYERGKYRLFTAARPGFNGKTASSLVVRMARERGFDVDGKVERQQVRLTSVDLGRTRVGFLQRMKIGGSTHRVGYLLW